jgi:hypothetical protein
MSDFEGFEPVYCSIDDYRDGGPPAKEVDLVEAQAHFEFETNSLYIIMLALKKGLWHRKEAAQHLAQPTTVRPLSGDFYAVQFTVYDANERPAIEADTIFRGGYLCRPTDITKPLKLGKQVVTGAYFKGKPGHDAESLDEEELHTESVLDLGSRRPVPHLSGLPSEPAPTFS